MTYQPASIPPRLPDADQSPGTDLVPAPLCPARPVPDDRPYHERPGPTTEQVAHWARWHHPRHIVTRSAGTSYTSHTFAQFHPSDHEPVEPPGLDVLLCGDRQEFSEARAVHERITLEVRAANISWHIDRYHRQMARILLDSVPDLVTWRNAYAKLTAAYAAIDTAPDNQWRSTIAALVAARHHASEAARTLSDRAADAEALSDTLPSRAREEVHTVPAIARTVGVDVTGWPEEAYGSESLASKLEEETRLQDAHIAEINRLAGSAAPPVAGLTESQLPAAAARGRKAT